MNMKNAKQNSSTKSKKGDKKKSSGQQADNKQSSKQNTNPLLNKISKRLDLLCSNYDHFILPNAEKSDEFQELTKSLYEHGQTAVKTLNTLIASKARANSFKPLSNLFVKGFDNEQIWQQLEVFNKPFLEQSVLDVSNLSSKRDILSLNVDIAPPKPVVKKSSKSILKTTEKASPDKPIKKEKTKKVMFSAKDALEPSFDEFDAVDQPQENGNQGTDFFNVDEMEAFLDAEDRKEMNGPQKPSNDNDEDEEDIDYFADVPSDSEEEDEIDEDGRNAMYSDFFDKPKSLTTIIEKVEEGEEEDDEEDEEGDDENLDTRDFDANDDEDVALSDEEFNDGQMLEDASDEDDDEDDQDENPEDPITRKLRKLANEDLNADQVDENDPTKSEFEKSQLKLRLRIEKAERELLQPSNLKWQLAGETAGDARPENSLLEEHLQFDHISKCALMITDQTTLGLEGIIKQRIKDKAFDDVERKEKPNEQFFEFRRRIMLESEKSKVGLAEVYENEFMKKQQQLKEQDGSASAFAAPGEVEETETRKEIRRQMRGLFRKLDSLSAFHYTPRPPEPEVKIISNMPAITVEEVTPDTVSDMKLLAPEEVFSTRGKKVLQAKDERSKRDRKRARRLKKKKQSIKQVLQNKTSSLKAAKVNQLEIQKLKQNKKTAAAESSGPGRKAFSSSTKFFERLQESKETGKVQKRKKANTRDPSLSKKLKL